MTQATKNIIENIYASEVPLTKDSPLKWYKNHGKFIHEDLYRQHNQDLLLSIQTTVKVLNQTIASLTILLKQADFALNQDIDNEIQRAEEIEEQLQQDIDDETQRSKKAENQLQQDIGNETQRAQKVENQLEQKISQANNMGLQLQQMQQQINALKPSVTNK